MKNLLIIMITVSMVFITSSCNGKEISTSSLNTLVMNEKAIVDTSNYVNLEFITIVDNQYFLIVKKGADWADSLWCLKFNKDTIIEKKQITDVEGEIIKYDLVDISQGEFLELYIASHQGNGQTILLDVNDLSVQFVFEGTVDFHNEGSVGEDIIQEFMLPTLPGYDKGYGYSFVYNGDMVTSVFSDLNDDGNTDVTFYGIKELVTDDENIPIQFIYIEDVYLYDGSKNQFFLSQDLSESKILE